MNENNGFKPKVRTQEERQRIIQAVKKQMPDINEDEIFVQDSVYGEVLSAQVRWNLDKISFTTEPLLVQ